MSEDVIVTTYEDEKQEITLDNIYVAMIDMMKLNAMLLSALIANSSDSVTEQEKEMIVHDSLFKVDNLLKEYSLDEESLNVN